MAEIASNTSRRKYERVGRCPCCGRGKYRWTSERSPRRKTPEYLAWRNMKARCLNPDHPAFKDYGGRGITICAEWIASYDAFLRDVGARPTDQHMLDREDNEAGYQLSNVRWTTRVRQNRNNRNVRYVMFKGKRMPLGDAAEAAGVKLNTVYQRLFKGWSEDQALGLVPRPKVSKSTRELSSMAGVG